MIKNNEFFIDNLESVVFIGANPKLSHLIKINDGLKLKSFTITSTDQSKNIDKKIDFKVYDKLDKDFESFICENFNPEKTLFFSLGARYIFKKEMIEKLFRSNLVNNHDTRLPLDAGGGGFSWHIMREDRINSQIIHLVDEGIDTGAILVHKNSLFPAHCKIPQDFEEYRLENLIKAYEKFIKDMTQGTKFHLKHQVDYIGRYNPRLHTLKNGYIDWQMDSYSLYNFINAFDSPYNGAITFLNNGKEKLHIKKVHLHGGDSSNHPFMSGLVSRHDKNWIVVSTTGKHMLLIEEVINQKGENIIHDIKVGDRFFTPNSHLEEAKQDRILYSSKGLK
tara:strand:+ start:1444 stop:2448 length:1005 start_codon:yes stop_codon:yes gene_type:complete